MTLQLQIPAQPRRASRRNGGLPERIVYAYWLAFSRPPTEAERVASVSFFNRFPANFSKAGVDVAALRNGDTAKAAWTSFCRALFASAEFRYVN